MTVVNIHAQLITRVMLETELRLHPMRLEERKEWEHDRDEGNTPLTSAAMFGNIPVVEFLLSIGANIEAKNEVRPMFVPTMCVD